MRLHHAAMRAAFIVCAVALAPPRTVRRMITQASALAARGRLNHLPERVDDWAVEPTCSSWRGVELCCLTASSDPDVDGLLSVAHPEHPQFRAVNELGDPHGALGVMRAPSSDTQRAQDAKGPSRAISCRAEARAAFTGGKNVRSDFVHETTDGNNCDCDTFYLFPCHFTFLFT